ncbi:MAG: zf-TFIIB domain-containing protein [Candidatus Binatia bacterium]
MSQRRSAFQLDEGRVEFGTRSSSAKKKAATSARRTAGNKRAEASRTSVRPKKDQRRTAPAQNHPRTTAAQKNRQTPVRKRMPKRALRQCPKCAIALQQRIFREVPIDECPRCHGIWLDKGEFEQVSKTAGQKRIGKFVTDLAKLMASPTPLQEEENEREQART